VNVERLVQDYANAEQRKAAALEELNMHVVAVVDLLEHLVDILTGNGGDE
jgi:hypothetical protein